MIRRGLLRSTRESVRNTRLLQTPLCGSCGPAIERTPNLDWTRRFAPRCIRRVRSSGTIARVKRRGWGQRELKKWFRDLLANVKDPVRREMHYFTLLTGIRRGDKRGQWELSGVTTLRWSDVSGRRREVTLQRAKGSKKVILPISVAAMRCLLRARIAGRMLYPVHGRRMVLPFCDRTNSGTQRNILARQERQIRQDNAAIAGRTCSSQFV